MDDVSGITGAATLKYRLEDEMLAEVRSKMYDGLEINEGKI